MNRLVCPLLVLLLFVLRLVFAVFRLARHRLLVSRGRGVVPGPDIIEVTDLGTITGGRVGVSTLNHCPMLTSLHVYFLSPVIVVGVHTDLLSPEVEGVLTVVH